MTEPVVVERHIEAPPDVVYAYLTDADKWARWQGVGASVEPSIGGPISLSMANGTTARGEFVELVPDRRVVFSWGWVGHAVLPPGSSTVEIVLTEAGSGTHLRLTHRGLPDDEVALHREGWQYYVPRLASASEGTDPGPDRGPT